MVDTISTVDIVRHMSQADAPLPPAAIHILLAIGPGERHGYAIMNEIATLTSGAVRLAPGTLYTNIKRLLASGLIEESDERPDPDRDDGRRRYYRLSTAGRRVVINEIARMESLITKTRPWVGELER
jgi:DNA-binding PadR family transcriptional regulator